MKKLSAVIASVLFSGAAFAQSYQSITNLEYTNVEQSDIISLDSIYYFSPKRVLGPLDQFDYVNTQSNIYGAVADFEDVATAYAIGGEYIKNQFVLGAEFAITDYDSNLADNTDAYSLSLGYLINDKFLVKVDRVDAEGADALYYFSTRYDHSLNNTDYVGFEFSVDEHFDEVGLSGKYFKDLKQGNFLTVEAEYIYQDEGSNYWKLGSSYYFNKMTSVFVDFDDEDFYNVGGKYYFNNNWAMSAGYGSNWDESDFDQWFLKATAQF